MSAASLPSMDTSSMKRWADSNTGLNAGARSARWRIVPIVLSQSDTLPGWLIVCVIWSRAESFSAAMRSRLNITSGPAPVCGRSASVL